MSVAAVTGATAFTVSLGRKTMACSSCGGSKSKETGPFIVTLKDGTTTEVDTEFAARVQVAKAGGGSYRKKT